jgi:adenosylcobinamide kinase / adenosylcobinamide-phosphate guanylyltransferase
MKMKPINPHLSTLVIGGCRSGKSRQALDLANSIEGGRKLFVATCVARDDEMRNRVQRHQQERGGAWQTLEIPVAIADGIADNSGRADVILVDCLTLWVSNLILGNDDPDGIAAAAEKLSVSVKNAACPVILVSNEVGCGIVPENRLARRYRDAAGLVNQRIAAACRQVVFVAAGIGWRIK